MDTKDLFKCIQETGHKENCDVTIKCRNGKVHTTKLILASWSTFWKEIQFLTKGKVEISGAQENIEVIEGL